MGGGETHSDTKENNKTNVIFLGTSYILSRGWGRDTKEGNQQKRYALLACVVEGGREGGREEGRHTKE